MKKTFLVLRAGLQETLTDPKLIVLFLVIGFILDNGVRRLVGNAQQVGEPIGVFEGFIMCLNHWYFLIIFLVGFIFFLAGVPRLDNEQILFIYRTGKKSWLFGEILQVAVCAAVYILVLLAGCMLTCAKYCFIGNVWSNFTVYYKIDYEKQLSDTIHFIDQQVFKYYMPYGSVLHGVLLLLLCMTLMGTVVIYFSILNKKLVGIILNIVLILFVLIFSDNHMAAMWISPFCHATLALHNTYVYRQLSVPLYVSYLYLALCQAAVTVLAVRGLKKIRF